MPLDPLIAIVQHQDDCPSAVLADWRVQAGARLVTVRPDLGARLPQTDDLHGLIVLGGSMGAGDDELAPWLPQVRSLIRSCADTLVPMLGICLGHQLAAVALGGEVDRNPHGAQYGLLPIGYLPDSTDDALFGGLARDVRGVHANNDVVRRVPDGTVVLARASTGEVQAARFAATVWGVQWHPEVSAEVFAGWSGFEPAVSPERARTAIAEVASARTELDQAWQPMAVRFAELCRNQWR